MLILLCLIHISSVAQYVSHVSHPDTSSPLIKNEISQITQHITAANLKELITYLASDSCEGRELGTSGIDRAAAYISRQFKSANIAHPFSDNYYQPVGFSWSSWNENVAFANEKRLKHLWDFVCSPSESVDLELATDHIIFLGFGIDDPKYSDYKNVDVKNKVILIYKGEPRTEKGKYHISNSTTPSIWSTDTDKKIQIASSRGAKAVLIIEDKFKELVEEKRNRMLSGSVELLENDKVKAHQANALYISQGFLIDVLGNAKSKLITTRNKINKSGKARSLRIPCDFKLTQRLNARTVFGQNILAVIEGTDKKDDYIILTAHYDHIGKRGDEVFNGADDNASGTSAVIEIAKALQAAKLNGKGPRRTVICMLVTGEEKGLLGSMYYVQRPLVPLEQTMVNINVDMIGRIDDFYKNNNYIYVIGSDRICKDLHIINEHTNNVYSKLILDYKYNDEKDPNRFYYRSDHYNFAEKGIPSIFFFSGTHIDYHMPGDDTEKIDIAKMETISRHICALVMELANREEKIR